MSIRRRLPRTKLPTQNDDVVTPRRRGSDALPLPLHVTNFFFSFLFAGTVYFLLIRRGDKISTSTPLRVVNLSEILSLIGVIASLIYLIGFLGVGFVQSVFLRSSPDDDDVWDVNDIDCPLSIQSLDEPPRESDLTSEEDEEIVKSVIDGTTSSYSLEAKLGDCKRAAAVRREAVQRITGRSLTGLPLEGFDYDSILGQCCEMPVGYVQIPVGIAGPLLLDGREYSVPMATTEGCLVASTNRGCKAIHLSGGAFSVLMKDAMSRAPVVKFPSVRRAALAMFYLQDPAHFKRLSLIFNKSSRFARLQSITCSISGRNLYPRFACGTGDAMGMNMVSKGVQNVLEFVKTEFPDMVVIGISGNCCSDKKASAINWIQGRGKHVVCEALIKGEIVKNVLKTSVEDLVELHVLKNLTGSAMAGSLGGFNAHASNIVSAVFIATGQDPAQNVESSHCITQFEAEGEDLHVSVSMPCIEVGTVGGGTQLASQSACLNLLGVKGSSSDEEKAGSNARQLARIIAGSVLAGELSLMSAIASGQLVKSHMKYNRSSRDIGPSSQLNR
ncbi:3-hydroxy-3-methylglutaryl-coenzyme A reductase 2 [Raphanus sativus]|uniref:3-hydroxy-3-methylglutaryl coenzyme A reductase n=1 Tax=Raphanus sativus TaxID=3726 RepID=A0A6J0JDC3_RAPSA|nr:3-hydroxy-3-methylglutaryl-coenzyme A reductase 2 [Raphanus sativus]KAJ4889126.1 3-hydroxy-3-methylglutaryl-coenzyme A reductase 2 [Raphanus sativus]